MIVKRKQIFDQYSKELLKYEWAKIPVYETPEKSSSYHAFLLRINGIDEEKRDKIIQSIFDKEVGVNVHFVPLPMMSFYKNLGYNIKDYPVSYKNYSCEISLPVYYNLSKENVQTVIKAVVESVEENI
jgi:dTDP-4-amino-4,6-dideoxygalactose transaminase